MVSLAEWFRRRVVVPVHEGSNPPRHPNNAGVASMVEHLFRNQGVAGSTPVSGSNQNLGTQNGHVSQKCSNRRIEA